MLPLNEPAHASQGDTVALLRESGTVASRTTCVCAVVVSGAWRGHFVGAAGAGSTDVTSTLRASPPLLVEDRDGDRAQKVVHPIHASLDDLQLVVLRLRRLSAGAANGILVGCLPIPATRVLR